MHYSTASSSHEGVVGNPIVEIDFDFMCRGGDLVFWILSNRVLGILRHRTRPRRVTLRFLFCLDRLVVVYEPGLEAGKPRSLNKLNQKVKEIGRKPVFGMNSKNPHSPEPAHQPVDPLRRTT